MLSAEAAASEIKRIIDDDPTIRGSGHILVSVSKRGFWFFKKEQIHLTGKVQDAHDRKKAEEIARHSAGGRELLNEITVTS
jgi:hypothetical protein